ncbi:MAG: hypothetical protein LBI69_03890, partial [Puniceicoccales bacterium]|nr:hypothetical protein [Puniceicoccales bacterium]
MEGSSVSFEGKTNGVSSPIFERTVTVLTCIALAATPLICHFISACSPLFVLGSGIFATIG